MIKIFYIIKNNMILIKSKKIIRDSGLFEIEYYLETNTDVRDSSLEPHSHYLLYGWKEGRNPSKYFDVSYYLETNTDVRDSGLEPLSHYLLYGWKEGRNPSPYFDVSYYLAINTDVRDANIEPLSHYLLYGWKDGRNPSPYFDVSYYLETNTDVRDSGLEPYSHYLLYGWKEGRNPSKYFDALYYLGVNIDVRDSNIEPLSHYLLCGWKENRWPNSTFNVQHYLSVYSDIKNSGLEPLFHYIMYGQKEGRSVDSVVVNYDQFIVNNEQNSLFITSDELIIQRETRFNYEPLISIIVPLYNTPTRLINELIDSIQDQTYQNWQLCFVDDASNNRKHLDVVEKFQVNDSRINLLKLNKNSGISIATNLALELAKGDFIALVDHDDLITADALFENVKAINEYEFIDILYSDECQLTMSGEVVKHFYKPDWSPELLFNCMYTGHLTLYSRWLIEQVGVFRKVFDLSQDYDYMLRAVEKARNIHHIEKILYFWRHFEGSGSIGGKPYARITNLMALDDAIQRRNIPAKILELPTANRVKIELGIDVEKVSIIVPTDSYDNLAETIDNIFNNTIYDNYEICPVTNSSVAKQIRLNFSEQARYLNIITYDKPYNFSDKCNIGAQHANGSILIFYNDDVRVFQTNWLKNLIEYLSIDGVGGVSPKLYYENETIQYAGMVTGVRNLVGTAFHCYKKDSYEYFNFIHSVRNVSILSGACVAIKKSIFIEIDGFDAVNTPIMGSDVDFSFKLLQAGYRCLYTPYAELLHIGHLSLSDFEMKQKKNTKDKADIYLLKHWANYFGKDPFFTDSMRALLYHDSREHFKIYPGINSRSIFNKCWNGDILIASHELSLTGAPMVVLYVCKFLIKNNYFVTVISPINGPLKDELIKIGVTVIVDELIFREHESLVKLARNFDLVIANTIVAYPVVKLLTGIVKVLWWLHEGSFIDDFVNYNNSCKETLKNAELIISPSKYALSFVKKYTDVGNVLYLGSDVPNYSEVNKNINKITLLMIGTIEGRKGQDILLNALKYTKCHDKQLDVKIVGKSLDTNYKLMIDELMYGMKNIVYLGSLTQEECLSLTSNSDILVCPSRDDPFSLVALQAIAYGKIVIMSDAVGISEFIQNGVSGFVFKNNDHEDLAKKINQAMRLTASELELMKRNLKKIYDNNLTFSKFEYRFIDYIKKLNILQT